MPEITNPKSRIPPAPMVATPAEAPPFAELDAITNYSFLRGASHPDEMVYRAAELGYRAIGITDINTLAGVVRAYDAVKQIIAQGGSPPKLIIGSRLIFQDAPDLLVWTPNRKTYGQLCRLLTTGKRRTEKGQCELYLHDFLDHHEGFLAAIVLSEMPPVAARYSSQNSATGTSRLLLSPRTGSFNSAAIDLLKSALGERLSLACSRLYTSDDLSYINKLRDISRRFGIPLLATNHAHYHDSSRRALQDVLTCIRHGCTIDSAGYRLFPNGERYLKSPAQMHHLFIDDPHAIARGLEIADQCTFNLGELRYEYPDEIVPTGMTPMQYLTELTWAGARDRYRSMGVSSMDAIPEKIRQLLEHELQLIAQLKIEAYFLTVYDIVRFARSRGILCQGRGSAANSAVCFCLGVTSVDPTKIDLLFERFVSAARNEPPDIDIDFEHERREEVLQYLYNKYGRNRAGMCAEVITYRGRSAVRDVGKAMGLSLDMVDSMAKRLDGWHRGTISAEQLRQVGLDPRDKTVGRVVELTGQILGFPRHLSQHVGGMVMTRGDLCELVPIENASMPDRTVIEWDKDDIDTLGILKVDVLGLGMLTCIAKGLKLVNDWKGREKREARNQEPRAGTESEDESDVGDQSYSATSSPASGSWLLAPDLQMHTIPPDDPAVYDMLCDADSVGVFQVESRAQMTMLPRLKPRTFYDLVIEVAIVRPGPIQGNMVHPYLRRRSGQEPVVYPSKALEAVLRKTLGVPLFQEQAMKLAMVGANFSAADADQLRRAMAAWRRSGALEKFYPKLIGGMLANGYTREFAEQCFEQIKGFGEYGFPESHAASFALLVYVSAWLKRHHPAAFACALLNSQPMGFYAPAQIVRDAAEHGVQILPIDINKSDWDCTLEQEIKPTNSRDVFVAEIREEYLAAIHAPPALRLGFRLIKGLSESHAHKLVSARQMIGSFNSIAHLHQASHLSKSTLKKLAEADAFGSIHLTRRQALWRVLELSDEQFPLFDESDSFCSAGKLSTGVSPMGHGRDARATTDFLPRMSLNQEVMRDYATTTLSTKAHPCALVREELSRQKIVSSKQMALLPAGRFVRTAGLVLIRQRPGTASGIVFETIEDETGIVNLVIRPDIYDRHRQPARHAHLLRADGYIQREGKVTHLIAKRLYDLSHLLHDLEHSSRDFH